jgi:hypothetical protein
VVSTNIFNHEKKINYIYLCKILGSESGAYEDFNILVHNAA